MTKQEFLDFCHEEFTKRGFKKRKKTYYLNGEGISGVVIWIYGDL